MTKQTVYLNTFARKSGFRLQDKVDLNCSFCDSLPFKVTTVGEVS